MALKKGSSIRLTWNRKQNHDVSDSETEERNAENRYFVTESDSEVKGLHPQNLSSYLIDGDCLDALPLISKGYEGLFPYHLH